MSQGTLWIQPINTVFKAGIFVPNAKAYFYLAGTSTPVNVYSDVGLTTPITQPVVADASNGAFVEIFLTPGTAYKVDVQTSAGVSLQGYPADNQLAIPASASTVDTTETAGEALTAGQAVYLSDGSGGKNAGQLYAADSANTYSSTAALVGMVPNAITSGAQGTFRVAGQITGLSVSAGTDYYVGTSGAITSTAPANARYLGRADSATSLIISRGMSALALPSTLTQSNAAGVTTLAMATQSPNMVLAGPTSGSAAASTFRVLDPQDLESLYATVTTQFDKATNTTLADVPGLTLTLIAGKTYHIEVYLRTATDATGGLKVGLGGTATATTFTGTSDYIGDNGSASVPVNSTAIATQLLATSGAAKYVVRLGLYIVVNAGGTLTIQFAQSSSSGTSSVLVGSYMRGM